MQEKLSVKKVYANAVKYTAGHLFAFAFLVIFYYLGSLLPMFIGTTSFKVLMIPYYYLFLYFAAGFYYKQQILWDRKIFYRAGLRFLTAIVLFLAVCQLCLFALNHITNFIRVTFLGGEAIVFVIGHTLSWQIFRCLFFFLLFISFFVVPSFAFVSEITGKSRSLLASYVKTEGNILRIAIVVLFALFFVVLSLYIFRFLPPYITELIRDVVLVFITIAYFKMYDFFYKAPPAKHKTDKNTQANDKSKNKNSEEIKMDTNNTPKQTLLAGVAGKFKNMFDHKTKETLPQQGENGDVNQG